MSSFIRYRNHAFTGHFYHFSIILSVQAPKPSEKSMAKLFLGDGTRDGTARFARESWPLRNPLIGHFTLDDTFREAV